MRLERAGLVARMAEGAQDIARAQELRHLCFLATRGLCRPGGQDRDSFDAACLHFLIEDQASSQLQGCFRVQILPAAEMGRGYAGQFYDLSNLPRQPGTVMELGRFCVHPSTDNPEVLRLAWAAITRLVDAHGVWLLFGCSSFPGADGSLHQDALAYLGQNHLPPYTMRPGRKAPGALDLPDHPVDTRRALADLPPLLRSYIGMGGWVSDHAVIDESLDTLHVFTALEVARIPAARARALRALAG